MIFQLIDDHARYAVASHVAGSETAEAAITVVDKGITAHGVPQRLLTDNGVALNPSRRGVLGQLVAHVTALGVEAITGKPYKPTTQGKNERFHQTPFRWLDKQPIAESIEQLQEPVDRFDVIHNTERPHQALPGRITPQNAWDATPKADARRPRTDDTPLRVSSSSRPAAAAPQPATPEKIRIARIRPNGGVRVRGVNVQIDGQLADQTVYVIPDTDNVAFADTAGTIIIEHAWPEPGVRYVGNGKPRGRRPRTPETSPMS